MMKLQIPSKTKGIAKKVATVKKKSKKAKKVKMLIPRPQIKHPTLGVSTQGRAMSTANSDMAGGFKASTRGGGRRY